MSPSSVSAERLQLQLRYSLLHRRTFVNGLWTVLAVALSLVALWPLFSVLYMLLRRGGAMLGLRLFTELTPGAGMAGGGIGNAILGTLVIVGVAVGASLPPSILAGVYLSEYGGTCRLAASIRFAGKVLSGMPSILSGVFAYAAVVVVTGSFSALAGALAAALIMIPTIMLTTEEALRMVQRDVRMAALGMGATRAQMVWRIVVPAAAPGMLVGIILAVARAMGETAPLLFTALFSDYWFEGRLGEPIASLAVLIYNFSGSPFRNQVQLAWAASLVLVTLVLVLSTIAQLLIRSSTERQ